MLLSAEHIFKYYNGECLLKDISFTVEDNERIGLIGSNGCGKSTLLRIITGEESFDKTPDGSGSVSISSKTEIGFLKQNAGLDIDGTIIDEMKKPFSELLQMQSRAQELAAVMESASGEELEKAASEYARLTSVFEAREGYLIDVKIKTVLNGMGFEDKAMDMIIHSLSGGEKTRLAMAKLLLEEPNLLILDEPTNHLDFKTLSWLEDYLKGYRGSVIIVSHDRYFLNKLCSRIFEIENGTLTSYTGDYSSYLVQKKMNTERQMKLYEAQQKQIANMQDFIDRNRVSATSAKAAKSRQHMLDRVLENAVEKPKTYVKPPKIKLEYDITPPKEVLKVSGVDISVGTGEDKKTLIDSFSLEVRRGEKVALIGENGIGKSTILKVIQGIHPHERGKIEWADNVKIAYFDQENAQLNFSNPVIEEVHRLWPRMTELEVRNALGSVLLSGEDVFKPVSVISGGERAKLCFAILMLKRGNVLILDEPTNHLDISTKEVLEEALAEFDGTMILVSHDRYLLNKVPSKIVCVEKNSAKVYEGNFDSYLEQSQAEAKKEEENKILSEKKPEQDKSKQYRTKEQRAKDAKRKLRVSELERDIERLEAEIPMLEREMCKPEVISDYEKMNQKCKELDEKRKELSEKIDEWTELAE